MKLIRKVFSDKETKEDWVGRERKIIKSYKDHPFLTMKSVNKAIYNGDKKKILKHNALIGAGIGSINGAIGASPLGKKGALIGAATGAGAGVIGGILGGKLGLKITDKMREKNPERFNLALDRIKVADGEMSESDFIKKHYKKSKK